MSTKENDPERKSRGKGKEAHAGSSFLSRWWRRGITGVLVLVVLLAVLVWFVPRLAVSSTVLPSIVSRIIPKFQGNVQLGSTSIGWFSTITIRNIVIRDQEGQPIVEIERLTISRTVWDLITNPKDIGDIVVENPLVHLVVNEDGTHNLATLIPESDEPATTPPDIVGNVNIQKGAVDIRASGDITQANVEDLNVAVVLAGPQEPIKVDYAGRCSLVRQTVATTDPATATSTPSSMSGSLSGGVFFDGKRLQINQTVLKADFGQLDLSGAIVLAQLSQAPTSGEPADALQGLAGVEQFEVKGYLDPARLAAAAPEVLSIPAGTELVGGRVDLAIKYQGNTKPRSFAGTLDVATLEAKHNGRVAKWEDPLQLDIVVLEKTSGFTFERLKCDSTFLDITADGELDQGSFYFELDLAQLHSELSSFFDMSKYPLGGSLTVNAAYAKTKAPATNTITTDEAVRYLMNMTANFNALRLLDWHVQGNGHFNQVMLAISPTRYEFSSPDMQIKNLHVVGPGCDINEPQIVVETSLVYDVEKKRLASNETTFRSYALAFLLEDFEFEYDDRAMPRLAGTLDFRTDLGRLRQWSSAMQGISPNERRTQTTVDGQANGKFTISGVTDQLKVNGWAVFNPVVTGPSIKKTSDGRYVQIESSEKRIPTVTLTTNAAIDREKDIIALEQFNLKMNSVQGAQGPSSLELVASGTLANVTTVPTIVLKGTSMIDFAQTTVLRDEIWEELFSNILPSLKDDRMHERIRLTGRETRPFNLAGPLSFENGISPQLKGQIGVAWQSADLLGLRIGPGEVNAHLDKGIVRFDPIDATVGRGRLHAKPTIYLNQAQPYMTLEKGPMLENINFTKEMTEDWLQYVAPTMTKATSIEGTFSLLLDEMRLPLLTPRTGTARGNLIVKSARVGPGKMAAPLIRIVAELLTVAKLGGAVGDADPSFMDMKDSNIRFAMVDGRVHHDGLAMQVGPVPITTRGSVGMDQSLAMEATLLLPKDLPGDSTIIKFLEGRQIVVPIRGSLNAPQLDGNILNELLKTLPAEAGKDFLEKALDEGIEKGLDGLFKGLLKRRQ